MSGHGIADEPAWGSGDDPGEALRDEPAFGADVAAALGSGGEDPDHELAAEQPDGLPGPYAERFASADPARLWPWMLLVALLGGPVAVASAFLAAGEASPFMILNTVVISPLVEELAKNLPCLWLCERRPWLLPGRTAIVFAAAMAGLSFAALENVLYLEVYLDNPTPRLVQWRWTVCVALHVGCAMIGSLGIARAWSEARATGRRGRVETMRGPLLVAAALHGAYNLAAMVMEWLVPF
jgi:RsiW-degrading membrane proteinase PrsW (M82 family)